jgi:threonine dehydratase
MPVMTPFIKVAATRGYGGEVVLHGANYDEAYQEAVRRYKADEVTLLHAFDDPAIIAGQGTIGLELLQQNPFLEAVVVPVGGGGLIGGIACAIKETNPRIRMIGVQTARIPSMKAAVEQHHPVTVPAAATIAEGIAIRRAGTITLPLVEKYVDEIVTVEEEEIASAILVLLERAKTVADGAGAAAVAALLQRKTSLEGKRAAVVVGGGNIDVTLLSRIIERGLVKDGRLVRLRVYVPDQPGALQGITVIAAAKRANIVEILHDRAYFGVHLGDTVIDITLETRGPEHVAEIVKSLDDAGYSYQRVQ